MTGRPPFPSGYELVGFGLAALVVAVRSGYHVTGGDPPRSVTRALAVAFAVALCVLAFALFVRVALFARFG